ncbi:MAG: MoxR family ATPase, partial [Candidatus Lokiarchaeota archaeon]|nr:MoxR family ATPase [Candidatus Lokiarchaeota archaeon]
GRCIGILLHGPPGTGKTLLATSLAKSFNSSYFIIDGSPDLDRRDIEGNWELFNGDTKFNQGPLIRAIKDANNNSISFIVINEINAIRESEQISLNSLLSESHINLISKGFERYSLKETSKLVIIGTMNKGVIGINKLQEAFEDRFLVCPEITYPSKQKEIEIAIKLSGCKKMVAETVVDAARQIRKQAMKDFSITKIFSTRLIVNFCLIISKMTPNYLRYNIENIIINKLGENQEEKKSIAMILDGKLFEANLKKYLAPNSNIKSDIITELIPPRANEASIISNFRNKVEKYEFELGNGKYKNKSGSLMWKFFDWFWHQHRTSLKDYLQLTEKLGYHKLYKEYSGRSHLYNGEITFSYIKWLYRNKNRDLMDFMRRICPVLD